MTRPARPCALLVPVLGLLLAGCGDRSPAGEAADSEARAPAPAGRAVESSGKEETALAAVPEEVLAAARRARPELTLAASEYELRDGREYYDLAGTLPDGSELELDLTRVDGTWTVVEVQRDVALDAVPGPVAGTLPEGWQPRRIIESDQGDGVVIYELYGPGQGGDEAKLEVKWAAGEAEVLEDEWLH